MMGLEERASVMGLSAGSCGRSGTAAGSEVTQTACIVEGTVGSVIGTGPVAGSPQRGSGPRGDAGLDFRHRCLLS
jgi:hypothetical protein